MKKYKTINGWTKQTMIDHVVANFKGMSVDVSNPDETPKCMYRGPEGKKCAVGLFIPDENYSSKFEGKSAYALPHELHSKMPIEVIGLDSFQSVHDMSTNFNCLDNILNWIENYVE